MTSNPISRAAELVAPNRPPVLRRAPRIGEDNERFGLPAVGEKGKEGKT